jgi:hypothetical protein
LAFIHTPSYKISSNDVKNECEKKPLHSIPKNRNNIKKTISLDAFIDFE